VKSSSTLHLLRLNFLISEIWFTNKRRRWLSTVSWWCKIKS